MVAALFSNSLYAENPNERKEAIDNLETSCNEAIEVIYNGVTEADIEADNPFMQASMRSLREQGVPDVENFDDIRDNIDNVSEEEDYEYKVDQD